MFECYVLKEVISFFCCDEFVMFYFVYVFMLMVVRFQGQKLRYVGFWFNGFQGFWYVKDGDGLIIYVIIIIFVFEKFLDVIYLYFFEMG